MFPLYNGLRNTSRLSGIVSRTYHNSIVCTPPQVKISNAEKLFALFCIAGSILISPMYLVPNFKKYASSKSG